MARAHAQGTRVTWNPESRLALGEAARRLGWPEARLAASLRARGVNNERPRWRDIAAMIGEGFNRSPGCVHGSCDEPRASRWDWP